MRCARVVRERSRYDPERPRVRPAARSWPGRPVRCPSRRGVYVRSFSSRELSDFYQLRIALETHAVRLAARHAPRERIDELARLLDETESSMDLSGPYPADHDFHARLARLAASPPLVD